MKFTEKKENILRDFLSHADENMCLPIKNWVTNTNKYDNGWYVGKRVKELPPFCKRIKRGSVTMNPQGLKRQAYKSFLKDSNKNVDELIVLDRDAMLDFFFACARDKEM